MSSNAVIGRCFHCGSSLKAITMTIQLGGEGGLSSNKFLYCGKCADREFKEWLAWLNGVDHAAKLLCTNMESGMALAYENKYFSERIIKIEESAKTA